MCNNCNCDSYDRCSIVGYMPIGFCCSSCNLFDEEHTCLKTKNQRAVELTEEETEDKEEFTPISTSIEGGLLKVVIKKKDKEIPIFIDLQKHLK